MALQGQDLDLDEVECILANLIYRKYVKGYMSHQHRVMVISKAVRPLKQSSPSHSNNGNGNDSEVMMMMILVVAMMLVMRMRMSIGRAADLSLRDCQSLQLHKRSSPDDQIDGPNDTCVDKQTASSCSET